LTIELRTMILIAGMSLPLSAQQQTDRALVRTLDGALAAGQMEQAKRTIDEMLARPHLALELLLETGAKLA
jgi:hypothetical protein